ncbi:MAG: metal-sensitive transcriptional regulator [Actinobacteria bacterium]|nr:metal-sensitive transcriptional regulator [Actinomycetota bacterium]
MKSGAQEPPSSAVEGTVRLVNRLARVEGQVRGLQRMVEDGKDCEQILTQLSAVRSALDGVGINLISQHMKDCLHDEIGQDIDPVAMEKAFDLFLKYVRCMK